ncbi:protein AMBP-like [Cetorhinus maximus]
MNYHEYAILIYESQIQGRKTKSVALYGRTRKLRKEINEQFKQFALKQGIPEDLILFLPERGPGIAVLSPWGITQGREDSKRQLFSSPPMLPDLLRFSRLLLRQGPYLEHRVRESLLSDASLIQVSEGEDKLLAVPKKV